LDVNAVIDSLAVAENEFRVEIADTPELQLEAFRLRHQVYSIERGFLPGENGVEIDAFDEHSRHVLLRHRTDNAVIGTVRVVGPKPRSLASSFPMQKVCPPSIFNVLPLSTTGEISRFAISKERRVGCTSAVLLRLALMRGILEVSQEMELTHWCAVMERSLLRLLKLSSIHFHALGPAVAYHGFRQPAAGSIAGILGRIHQEQELVWRYLTADGALCPSRFAHHQTNSDYRIAA
jgi:N-acyl-L-homoserine lactone synthetase